MDEHNKTPTIDLSEVKEQLDNLMRADNSGALPLLQLMGVALMATATQIINKEELMTITDSVEIIKDMPKGIERDLKFEGTRNLLKEKIGYIE